MNNTTVNSYKELIVWQKAMDLVVLVYELTEQLPKNEQYGLTAQMKRSAVSIPSNIAEGRRRGGIKEYCHFLFTAYASGAELETQIEIAKRLPFSKGLDYSKIDSMLSEVMKILNKMISNFR